MKLITHPQLLANELAESCIDETAFRIGIEHEKFVCHRKSQHPLPYRGPTSIHTLLEELQQFGWSPVHDLGNLVGLRREQSNITLEPAGQLELAGAPWPDLHKVNHELVEHHTELDQIARELDLDLLPVGFAPSWPQQACDRVPNQRHLIMYDYMPLAGNLGRDMMLRTCSVQINLDYSSEQDMCDKYRVAMFVQPLIMVALANSPFLENRDSSLTSYRNYVWLHTDSARCGILPAAFSDDFGFDKYAQRAVDTPMYSVKRNDVHVNLAGRSFRDMMSGKLPELPGAFPTQADGHDHLNTLMHDVRLKKHIEIRGNDSLPRPETMALTAFWTGLLYDADSLAQALETTHGVDLEWLLQLRHRLPGLTLGETRDPCVKEVYGVASIGEAITAFTTLAKEGLKRRDRRNTFGDGEDIYLKPLEQVIATGKSPAEQSLERFYQNRRSARPVASAIKATGGLL